jgi:hypothetical protein
MKKYSLEPRYLFQSLVILIFFCCKISAAYPEECGKGKKLILYKTTPAVDSKIRFGFSDDFYDALNAPLKEIGYCPIFLDPNYLGDTLQMDTPVLLIDVRGDLNGIDTESTLTFIIYFLYLKDVKANYSIPRNADQLISLKFDPAELSTFETVAVRKTVENLRTQYVCHLRLESDPSGVLINSSVGLEGKTPLEWVIPVGNLQIEGTLKGYSVLNRNIKLDSPGVHTYVLEMRARQFYNSRFMIPTVVFGVSSAVLFGIERYYYARYVNLDREVYFSNPEQFEVLFNKAKVFEYAAFSSLALTGISFTLTFLF